MKKAILMILLAALLATPLTGCDTADSDDEPAKTTTESKDNGDNIPDYNAADANPASDFEYKVGEDGGITITKYIGTDTDVVIPEKIDGKNVTVIGDFAMSGNTSIISVKMSDSIIMLADHSFYSCTSLTTIVCSEKLQSIGNNAFQNCSKLGEIVLPDSLTHIGANAFAHCISLKHIKIPANAFTLNSSAAFSCSGLQTVELTEGIQILPVSVFHQTSIKEIIIPSSVKSIQTNALSGCNELTTIMLHEGIQTIELYAFASNPKLTEIIIPSTVTSISPYSFNKCLTLEKIYFEGNAPDGYIYTDGNYTIYYHEGATGFTSPEWNGYQTEIW